MLLITIFLCVVLNLNLVKCGFVPRTLVLWFRYFGQCIRDHGTCSSAEISERQNKGTKNMTITLPGSSYPCVVAPHHEFTAGDTVKLLIENNIPNVKFTQAWATHKKGNITNKLYLFNETQNKIDINKHSIIDLSPSIQAKDDGKWEFIFHYNDCAQPGSNSCSQSIKAICNTKFIIVSAPLMSTGNLLICITVGGVILSIIIIAEAIAIYQYRKKVQKLRQHSNLLSKTTSSMDVNDSDRYSSNPIQKAKKFETNRNSEIYEVPDITVGGAAFNPPLPGPRPDVGLPLMRMPPPPSPALTIRSNASSHPTFPRKPADQGTLTKTSLAQRPPMLLPEEFYSEAQEDNVYEPPPINEESPPARAPPQPKKFGNKLPEIPMEALKPRGSVPTTLKPTKPLITQPRPTPTPSRHNEVKPTKPKFADDKPALPRFPDDKPALPRFPDDKPALPRFPDDKPALPRFPENKPSPARNPPENKPSPARNPPEHNIPGQPRKVFQVPIKSIPGPSTLKKNNAAKPKPPVPTPKAASPLPTLEQQVKFFNDNRPIHQPSTEAWDDEEEWTYEPLYNI